MTVSDTQDNKTKSSVSSFPGDELTTTTTTHLRIIQINDVYELDQLPRFKSLIDDLSSSSGIIRTGSVTSTSDITEASPHKRRSSPDKTIVICCGDFVAPSLLSSLDEGYSMIDCLNGCGIQYVCFGNHEADISITALHDRIVHQSQFIWINSNIRPQQQQPEVDEQETSTVAPSTDQKTKLVHPHRNNILSLPYDKLPEYCEISIPKKQQSHPNNNNNNDARKIVLLGLLTDDPSLYRLNAFGGNITIAPIIQRTQELIQQIYHTNTTSTETTNQQQPQPQQLPLIIPMTHQSIQNDRIMAQTVGHVCPILCGGHDHEIYHEHIATTTTSSANVNLQTPPSSHDTCHIVKAGMDAHNAAVIDIVWHDDDPTTQPHDIQVQMISTHLYEPDPIVQQQVQKHQLLLHELEQAKLFRISDWIMNVNTTNNSNIDLETTTTSAILSSSMAGYPPFSTINNRIQPSSGTTAICTMIQMGMRTTCCIVNAGAVRGNTTYPNTTDSYFTWANLKNEIPFSTEMCVCTIPGRVIEQMIFHSRLGSYTQPPIASGGYLHTCRNVEIQEEDVTVVTDGTNPCKQLRIISIGDEPFDPNREYLTAIPKQFLDGIDNHVPLLEWAALTKLFVSDETCIPAKIVLVQVFAATMWLQMGQFDDIDINHDGMISRDEIRHRLIELNGGRMDHVADLIVDNLLSICDLNEDGTISPMEMMICQYVATDMLRHVGTREEIRTITNIVMNVLGDEQQPPNTNRKVTSYEDVGNLVESVRNMIDVHGDGKINRNDISEVFKGNIQRGSDMLH